MKRTISALAIVLMAATITSCGDKVDEGVKARLMKAGYSESVAAELSGTGLIEQEIVELEEVGQARVDGTAVAGIVKSMHERDLRFDVGSELRLLANDSLGATAMAQLVEIGAIPRWTDDISALKQGGVGDVTIIELAKMQFVEKKELLSGGEYARLRKHRLTDAGLLTFVRNNGTPQQAQQIALALDLGKSEQEALKEAGM